jgi:hypothetical protein
MKKALLPTLTVFVLLSACNQKPAETATPATAAVARAELTPENVTNTTWKNGVWVENSSMNGFFFTGDATVAPAKGAHLTFAKSGDRVVTDVIVKAPYVNIYVDKPLDPVGDGYPNKVKQ